MVGWRSRIAVVTVALVASCFWARAGGELAAAYAPVVPDPIECTVTPRPTEELLGLITTDAASQPTYQEVAYPTLLHDTPSDPAVVEEITATARELTACLNAGDPRRTYALYSDEAVRQGVAIEPEEVEISPVPLPEAERIALLDVSYVRPFADGRVGAVLVIDDPAAAAPAESFFVIFARTGERWVLDDFPAPYVVEAESSVRRISPGDATPAP